MSEHLGLGKLGDQLNFDKHEGQLNPFLWSWKREQVEKLIGRVRPMVRLSEKQLALIQEKVMEHKDKPWGEGESLLVQTLYESVKERLMVKDGKVVIQ